MKARRIAAAGVSFATALTLTACGSSTGSSFTPLTLVDFGTSVSHGVASVTTGHADVTSSFMSLHEDFTTGPPFALSIDARVRVHGRDMAIRERIIDTLMYMQVPGETPAGKFLKVDLTQLPQTAGIVKFLHRLESAGPRAFADQFKAGVKSLTYDGPVTVDGHATRHYTVVVDARAAVKLVGGDTAAQAYASRVKQITEQVYLGDDNRPIRVTMAMPAPVGQMQIDFSDYGKQVDIAAPPASQVIDVPASELGLAG